VTDLERFLYAYAVMVWLWRLLKVAVLGLAVWKVVDLVCR
jgi:hypothetical protein